MRLQNPRPPQSGPNPRRSVRAMLMPPTSAALRRRKGDRLAVDEEQRLPLLRDRTVHQRGVPVFIDVCDQALLGHRCPDHDAWPIAPHRPRPEASEAPEAPQGVCDLPEIDERAAHRLGGPDVQREVDEVEGPRKTKPVQQADEHEARVLLRHVPQRDGGPPLRVLSRRRLEGGGPGGGGELSLMSSPTPLLGTTPVRPLRRGEPGRRR
mmetsp:Transcript_27998/g.80393  ORF Transcript_27998/g.80393 Transcript_27998/m.80393 type:complete len:209 (-) Transcript_27998:976-1602(-)